MGCGGTNLLKLVFALLDPCGFDAVHEGQQLALETEQLCAGLAESAVGVGELSYLGELFGRRSDVLRPILATIGEDGAGVEFSLGAAAVGLSAAAAEDVEGTGEEGLPAQERFQERGELLLQLLKLEAEGAEVVCHGLVLRGVGLSVYYYTDTPTEVKRGREEFEGNRKKAESPLGVGQAAAARCGEAAKRCGAGAGRKNGLFPVLLRERA
jgi:hypothetical protein